MAYIGTRDVAAHLRKQLKTTFPGVKFSVRCDRGTAASWIDVTWTDGPDETAVRELTHPLRGSHRHPQTQEYIRAEPLTVRTKGGTVTGEPLVDGFLVHRKYSDAVLAKATELWAAYNDGADITVAACVWQDAMYVEGQDIREGPVEGQVRQIAAKVVLAS